jgi:hypothetical protein
MRNWDKLLHEKGVRDWIALPESERDEDEYRFVAIAVRTHQLVRRQAMCGRMSSPIDEHRAYPSIGLLAYAENDGSFA